MHPAARQRCAALGTCLAVAERRLTRLARHASTQSWAREQGIEGDYQQLCADSQVGMLR